MIQSQILFITVFSANLKRILLPPANNYTFDLQITAPLSNYGTDHGGRKSQRNTQNKNDFIGSV